VTRLSRKVFDVEMRGTGGWESAKIKELIVPGVPINQTGFLMDALSDTGVRIGVDFIPESSPMVSIITTVFGRSIQE